MIPETVRYNIESYICQCPFVRLNYELRFYRNNFLVSNSLFKDVQIVIIGNLQSEYISKQYLLIINCNTRSLVEKMFRPIIKGSNWYSRLRDILHCQSPLLTLLKSWIWPIQKAVYTFKCQMSYHYVPKCIFSKIRVRTSPCHDIRSV